MRKIVFAALLALPVFAVSSRAQCCGSGGFGGTFGLGINWCYSLHAGCGGGCPSGCCPGGGGGVGQYGPWYLYWPMEAHFQTPAPTGYPYWPAPLTLPPSAAYGAPAPGNFQPAPLQPAGYGAPPPSYWSR
ncbi:MAG TPA: hypothetical protein VMS17_13400 [Gemmataceae bacterium]|nr:hypothetical protein [Gemmataceae bacterium]